MLNNYVTEEEGKSFVFEPGCIQSWNHMSVISRTPNESVTIRYFLSLSDSDQRIGLEVLIFLSQFSFATRDQIEAMLENKRINPAPLDQTLSNFQSYRILNSFAIATRQMEKIPDDALRIYCLDHGAKYILTHFYREDFVYWRYTDNYRSIEQVEKTLSVTRFYLELAKVKQENLRMFEPRFRTGTRYRDMEFSAYFEIQTASTVKRFILESVRNYTFNGYWHEKITEQIAPFFSENFWNRQFPEEPILILLAETRETAVGAADTLYRGVNMRRRDDSEPVYTNFRVTTDEDIMKGLENAKFFKYVADDNGAMGTLVPVKAPIFTKKDI